VTVGLLDGGRFFESMKNVTSRMACMGLGMGREDEAEVHFSGLDPQVSQSAGDKAGTVHEQD
jgi:hypothetical protein